MRPKSIAYTIAAADADGICLSQTRGSAGALTLNGALVVSGVGVMDIPRHVSVTAVGNESGVSFTITGTDRYGQLLAETITGPNASTTKTTKNFRTVTSVAVSGALAGNVTVGSADELETAWVPIDFYKDTIVGVSESASFSADYEIETTLDDIYTINEHNVFIDGVKIGSDCVNARAIRLKIWNYVSGDLTLSIVTRS